jgi:hypothetical protein
MVAGFLKILSMAELWQKRILSRAESFKTQHNNQQHHETTNNQNQTNL